MSRDKNHPCEGCKFFYSPAGRKNSPYRMCLYWEIKGTLRPCKPGEACTVKELAKGKRKKRLDNKFKSTI